MKDKYIQAHMAAAYVYAALSSCDRRQVGCVIVKDNSIISIGYNGTAPGECNSCENEHGETLPGVIHAEDNALQKLSGSTASAKGAVAFITLCPCNLCAPRLVNAGITTVYYSEIKPTKNGMEYLIKNNVEVIKVTKQ